MEIQEFLRSYSIDNFNKWVFKVSKKLDFTYIFFFLRIMLFCYAQKSNIYGITSFRHMHGRYLYLSISALGDCSLYRWYCLKRPCSLCSSDAFFFAVKIKTSELISRKYRRCLDTILQTVTWKLPRIFLVLREFLLPVAMDICSYCSVSLFFFFFFGKCRQMSLRYRRE